MGIFGRSHSRTPSTSSTLRRSSRSSGSLQPEMLCPPFNPHGLENFHQVSRSRVALPDYLQPDSRRFPSRAKTALQYSEQLSLSHSKLSSGTSFFPSSQALPLSQPSKQIPRRPKLNLSTNFSSLPQPSTQSLLRSPASRLQPLQHSKHVSPTPHSYPPHSYPSSSKELCRDCHSDPGTNPDCRVCWEDRQEFVELGKSRSMARQRPKATCGICGREVPIGKNRCRECLKMDAVDWLLRK